MERLLQQQQQQQQQQRVALPNVVLQLAVAHIKLWQQIIDVTNISNSELRQTFLSSSKDLLLTVQPAARLSAAVLVAVPRGCVGWLVALATGDLVLDALSKEVKNIGSDPASIALPSGMQQQQQQSLAAAKRHSSSSSSSSSSSTGSRCCLIQQCCSCCWPPRLPLYGTCGVN
jgi:hypothetical protein